MPQKPPAHWQHDVSTLLLCVLSSLTKTKNLNQIKWIIERNKVIFFHLGSDGFLLYFLFKVEILKSVKLEEKKNEIDIKKTKDED